MVRLRPGGVGAGAVREAAEEAEPVLPEAVRARVLALAATALGRMPAEAGAGAAAGRGPVHPDQAGQAGRPGAGRGPLRDAVFRLRAAEQVERESPDMAEAARTGVLPGAADPVELAAAAYLLRPAGWTDLVERSRTALEERAARTRDRARDAEVEKLRAEVAAAHAAGREQAAAGPGGGRGGPGRGRDAAPAAARADRRAPRGRAGPGRGRGGAGRGAPPGRRRGLPRSRPSCAGCGSGWPRPRTRSRPAGARPATPGRPTRPGSGCCWTP